MINDAVIKVLLALGLMAHLAAPVVGVAIGQQRLPVSIALVATGAVALILTIPHLNPGRDGWLLAVPIALYALALGAGSWWLASPGTPAAIVSWICYGLDLLFLGAALFFYLAFGRGGHH